MDGDTPLGGSNLLDGYGGRGGIYIVEAEYGRAVHWYTDDYGHM